MRHWHVRTLAGEPAGGPQRPKDKQMLPFDLWHLRGLNSQNWFLDDFNVISDGWCQRQPRFSTLSGKGLQWTQPLKIKVSSCCFYCSTRRLSFFPPFFSLSWAVLSDNTSKCFWEFGLVFPLVSRQRVYFSHPAVHWCLSLACVLSRLKPAGMNLI